MIFVKSIVYGWLILTAWRHTPERIPAYRAPLKEITKPSHSVAALFGSPIKRSLTLSGTFGELRPNHFHAGLDIKSLNGKVGEPVYAAAEGFVARIKISAYGYGRAIYIQHPNGHTSVYAHLDHFIPSIDNHIKKEHYKRERFEMDLTLPPSTFPIKAGQIVAYMGNSGSSTGPHLHFEIRNSMNEHVLNPLDYGIKIDDDIKPTLYHIKFYGQSSLSDLPLVTLPIKKQTNGQFTLEKDTILVNSDVAGFAIKTYDQSYGSSQRLGIYGIKMYVDDALRFQFDMNDLSFDEMRYSNAHRDYEEQAKSRQVFHRLFKLDGNKLPIYKQVQNNGWVPINGTAKKIRIEVFDFARNTAQLEFFVSQAEGPPPAMPFGNHLVQHNQKFLLEENQLKIEIPAHRLYQDTYLHIHEIQGNSSLAPIYKIHDSHTPIHRAFTLAIKPNTVPARLRSKLAIGMISGGNISNQGGTWDGEWLETHVNSFGNYTILADTVPPTIKNIVFKSDLSKNEFMRFNISDNFGVGGDADELKYTAWIDGKWMLMELDSKTDNITHYFDEKTGPGKHLLKLQVTDDKGNTRTFVQHFMR